MAVVGGMPELFDAVVRELKAMDWSEFGREWLDKNGAEYDRLFGSPNKNDNA